jgi:hypothetical protein
VRAGAVCGAPVQAGRGCAALRPLRFVWLAQLVLASVLIFMADEHRLRNPAGAMLAIVFGVSLGGAALFGLWRLAAFVVR